MQQSVVSRALARSLCAAIMATYGAAASHATWSIVVVDTQTREVGVASATCLTGFDLERYLPVIRVRTGAGVAQSAVDVNSGNRRRIWNGLIAGQSPEEILANLAMNDGAHQTRQYGIVDVLGRTLTFTGSQAGAWAGGVSGQIGPLVYAIQGNVLTCDNAVLAAEAALRDTSGPMPERLLAAMEAARAFGGDGRCSCFPNNPTGCGCPPTIFTKSAHVGFLVVARRGDLDGVCNAAIGCASGTYFLDLNVAFQQNADADPVIQLRNQLTAWRQSQVGVPDAIESTIALSRSAILADGQSTCTMTVELRDWQGAPIQTDATVTVQHDADGSAGSCMIGPVQSLGGGRYAASLVAGTTRGIDTFQVTASTATHAISLMPSATLRVQDPRADLNHDGSIDLSDLAQLLANFGSAGPLGDMNGDGGADLSDLGDWLGVFGRGY